MTSHQDLADAINTIAGETVATVTEPDWTGTPRIQVQRTTSAGTPTVGIISALFEITDTPYELSALSHTTIEIGVADTSLTHIDEQALTTAVTTTSALTNQALTTATRDNPASHDNTAEPADVVDNTNQAPRFVHTPITTRDGQAWALATHLGHEVVGWLPADTPTNTEQVKIVGPAGLLSKGLDDTRITDVIATWATQVQDACNQIITNQSTYTPEQHQHAATLLRIADTHACELAATLTTGDQHNQLAPAAGLIATACVQIAATRMLTFNHQHRAG